MVCDFLGLKSVEELICARQNRFVTKYIVREQFMWPNIEKILYSTLFAHNMQHKIL